MMISARRGTSAPPCSLDGAQRNPGGLSIVPSLHFTLFELALMNFLNWENIMPEEKGDDAATEFAKELARQLPVKAAYKDLAKPAAQQAGQFFEDIVKVLQLALAPVQYLGALQDRYRTFLNKSIRRVPEEDRVSPAPQIVGPVLEGIRYEPEGTPIDEMFSQLLSRSMDSHRVGEAHPAFPIIIRQLSSDEARILKLLGASQYDFVYTSDYDNAKNLFFGQKIQTDGLPRDKLAFPDNVRFYMEHLHQLGLAGIFQHGNQFPLLTEGKQTGVKVVSKYRLTDLGQRFVHACIAGEKA